MVLTKSEMKNDNVGFSVLLEMKGWYKSIHPPMNIDRHLFDLRCGSYQELNKPSDLSVIKTVLCN